jgi:MFS family permease
VTEVQQRPGPAVAAPDLAAARAGRAPAWLRGAIGGLPRPFWVLWSGTLVNRIGYLVEPFLAYYLTGVRGFSLATTGAVLAVSGLGSVFSQLAAGALTDRIGRRATLALGMLTNAGALAGLGYARGLAAIMVAVLLFGITVDVYRPASSALIADLVPSVDRARAYGILFWAVNLGFSVAMVLGGALARTGFRWLFWADALTCAAFSVIAWAGLPADRPRRTAISRRRRAAASPSPAGARDGSAGRGSVRDLARDGVMMAYLALTFCYCLVYLQAYTTLPLAMRLQGLPPGSFGLAIAVNGIVIVAVQPLVSGWLGRHDHSSVLAVGFLIGGLGVGLTALAHSTAGYAVTVVVWTLGEIVTAGLGAAIVSELAPAHMRGRYNGVYGAIWSAAYLVAPLGGTRLLAIGAPVLWLTCACLGGVAAASMLALGPAIRRRSGGG